MRDKTTVKKGFSPQGLKGEQLGENPKERRKKLLSLMSKSQGCHSCDAPCCTFRHNSMQITPLEAHDILQHLKDKGLWTDTFKTKLQDNINHYRLNVSFPLPNGIEFRRSYTCPFYKGGEHGCSLSANVKPFGCLAFNPFDGGKKGQDCATSDEAKSELERICKRYGQTNKYLETKLRYQWKKRPIPVALLELDSQIEIP